VSHKSAIRAVKVLVIQILVLVSLVGTHLQATCLLQFHFFQILNDFLQNLFRVAAAHCFG
jgi:hypothetical protein